MPIFAYRCASCGFEKDVLQKRSDPPLDTCPSCGQDSFAKQLTAPAFQLKGSGWYATDFRDKGKAKPDAKEAGTTPGTAASPAEAKSGGDGATPAEKAAPSPAPSTPSSSSAPDAPTGGKKPDGPSAGKKVA